MPLYIFVFLHLTRDEARRIAANMLAEPLRR
jgi:hypothetical protein